MQKHCLAAPKSRGDMQGAITPHRVPLSSITYSHLPADGTHYMFDLSTTFQNAGSEDGTYSVPGCFTGHHLSLV